MEDQNNKIGLPVIWAIGVGSALGGDFFGWQFVLYGGFGSALFAVLFTGAFYWLYVGAITELAARYRTSGGSFDFVRNAMGRQYASWMAILGLLKLLLANSANALAISSYLVQAGMSKYISTLIWIAMYVIFTTLDCIGVRQSANLQVLATLFCVIILLFYAASALSIFDSINIKTDGFTNNGVEGFFKGLPFALQFFDGFEEVPLLMGYASKPDKTIPKAIVFCYITVFFIALAILIAGSGSASAQSLLNSEAPLMDVFELVYGDGTAFSDIMAYFVVLGLVVNFFSFILFSSQQVQAVAEAKQMPHFLSYRSPVSNSPVYASITTSIVGFLLTASFAYIFGEDAAQNMLVTAALMPAVLGYALLLQAIISVRFVESHSNTNMSSIDVMKIGYDPGALRFQYGILGARIAQIMCFIFAIGLMVLATINIQFGHGLIALFILAVLMYIFMRQFTPANDYDQIAEDFGEYQYDTTDDLDNTDTVYNGRSVIAPSIDSRFVSKEGSYGGITSSPLRSKQSRSISNDGVAMVKSGVS